MPYSTPPPDNFASIAKGEKRVSLVVRLLPNDSKESQALARQKN